LLSPESSLSAELFSSISLSKILTVSTGYHALVIVGGLLVNTPNGEAHFNQEDAGDLAYELLEGEAVVTMKQREQRPPALRYWMAWKSPVLTLGARASRWHRIGAEDVPKRHHVRLMCIMCVVTGVARIRCRNFRDKNDNGELILSG
jgi:hypothetical protein